MLSCRFHIGRESIVSKSEIKRREAVWDLFQSEVAFLVDHLMVLKNVSDEYLPSTGWLRTEIIFFSTFIK